MGFWRTWKTYGILWEGFRYSFSFCIYSSWWCFSRLPKGLLEDIFLFCEQFFFRIDEIQDVLNNNRIWKDRLVDIGIVSKNVAFDFGFTGVMLRASGIPWDLRFSVGYECYDLFDSYIPIGFMGDCYDRYLIRVEELRSSLFIIFQCFFLC